MERNKIFLPLEFYSNISCYAQIDQEEEDEIYDIILDGGEVTE